MESSPPSEISELSSSKLRLSQINVQVKNHMFHEKDLTMILSTVGSISLFIFFLFSWYQLMRQFYGWQFTDGKANVIKVSGLYSIPSPLFHFIMLYLIFIWQALLINCQPLQVDKVKKQVHGRDSRNTFYDYRVQL